MISTFVPPLNVLSRDRLYLSGYSYYRLQESQASSPPAFVAKEENELIAEFRWSAIKSQYETLVSILDRYPYIPRLLSTARGRFDQEAHDALFGALLTMGRSVDLRALYNIAVSEEPNAEEETITQLITQRETFGSRFALIHEKIPISTSHSQCVTVRGIDISVLFGRGSFGYVFDSVRGNLLTKYNTITAEYVRELLCSCLVTITNDDSLPREVQTPCSVTADMVQNHLLSLTPLLPITRTSILVYAEEFTHAWQESHDIKLSVMDQVLFMIRALFNGIRALRDRFMVHLDLSTTNIMWDSIAKTVRVIDCTGTIGDDSFFDIGTMLTRVCTRSTRAPEYSSQDTLWQRNENSEALCAYYALMNHLFPTDLVNSQPYAKEEACGDQVRQQIEASNPCRVPEVIRRLHQSAFSLPRDRPPLDWLLSDGSTHGDRYALEIGYIGSTIRHAYMKNCVNRYMSNWPHSRFELTMEWKVRRNLFIKLLLARVDCAEPEGTTCGGLLNRVASPPYISTRCISLYDALRDIAIDMTDSERVNQEAFIRYMNDLSCYPIMVNAILYIALAPSKATLIDVEHYHGHPLHAILRIILLHKELLSIFLSPITAYILMLLEKPKRGTNDEKSDETRRSSQSPTPQRSTSHRIIRCLYNLRRDRRCQPMFGESLTKIATFTRNYMHAIISSPIVLPSHDGEEQVSITDTWWKWLFEMVESKEPVRSAEHTGHVENVIRLWFT